MCKIWLIIETLMYYYAECRTVLSMRFYIRKITHTKTKITGNDLLAGIKRNETDNIMMPTNRTNIYEKK